MGKGGGGGLAFLNKKSWHPGGFKQQEEVWKREQAKAEEEKRLEELRKQINEEREHQELLRVAREAGHVFKEERLEFMYKGPLAGGPALGAPTGPATAEPPAGPAAAPVSQPSAPVAPRAGQALSVYVDDTPAARNEAWARLHADPMLMIKQREQAQLKNIRANPVKMDSILKEVEALKEARRSEKQAKRAKKESKRAAKRESKRHHRSRSRSSSDSREPEHSRRHHRSRSRSRSRSGGERSRHRYGYARKEEERRRSRSPRRVGRPRDASPARHHRSRSHSGEARERTRHGDPGGGDGAVAQRGVSAYGLTFASAEAEAAARAHAEAARERPAYVPNKAPQAAPPDSWHKGKNSVRHTAGRLTEEERAQRLAAMAADADAHDTERWNRLHRDAQRSGGDVSLEQHAPKHHHSEKPAFLSEQETKLFGARGADGGDALAERVGARKHFNQRETGNAFRRE